MLAMILSLALQYIMYFDSFDSAEDVVLLNNGPSGS